MTQTVLGQINTFTELYGKKHGYDLILGTTSDGSILYDSDRLDITDQFLDALNHYYATGEVKKRSNILHPISRDRSMFLPV